MSIATKRAYLKVLAGGGTFMKHIKMFRAALATLAAVFAGGYAFAEETQVEDTPEVEETPAVTKVKWLKPKYTSTMTVEGYSGETELENFPVAVRISTANIPGFDYSKCDGEGDITFTDDEGNILPHEIEVWNTEGESVAWVSIPKLATVVAEDKTTYTTFKMNWGHETKLANIRSNEVWTAADYRGVWHMNEYDPEKLTQYDSTGNGFNATYATSTKTTGISMTSAKIGKAFYRKFDKNTVGECATTPKLMATMKLNYKGCMVSGWAYYSGYTATGQQYLFRVENTDSSGKSWGLTTQSKTIRSKFKTNSGVVIGSGLSPASGWFHWVIRVTGSKYEYFLNGVLLSEKNSPGSDADYSQYAGISRWTCGGVTGFLDEMRYKNGVISDDWIKAEYDSINNKQFVVASESVKNGYGLKIIVR